MSITWGAPAWGYATQGGLPNIGGGRGFNLQSSIEFADFSGPSPAAVSGSITLDATPEWGLDALYSVVRLADNKVLTVCGIDSETGQPMSRCSILEFSGDSASIYSTDPFPVALESCSTTLLADGRVLATGGWGAGEYESDVVRFGTCSGLSMSWQTGTIATQPDWAWQDLYATRALLPDGRILISPVSSAVLPSGKHPLYLATVTGTSVSVIQIESPSSAYLTRATLCCLSDGRIFFGIGADIGAGYAGLTECWTGVIAGDTITWTAQTPFPYPESHGFQAAIGLPGLRIGLVGTSVNSLVIGTVSGLSAGAAFQAGGTASASFTGGALVPSNFQSTGAASTSFLGGGAIASALQAAGASTSAFSGGNLQPSTFQGAGSTLLTFSTADFSPSAFASAGAGASAFTARRIVLSTSVSAGAASAAFEARRIASSAARAEGHGDVAFVPQWTLARAFSSGASSTAEWAARIIRQSQFSAAGASSARYFQPARGTPRSIYIYTTPNEVTVRGLR